MKIKQLSLCLLFVAAVSMVATACGGMDAGQIETTEAQMRRPAPAGATVSALANLGFNCGDYGVAHVKCTKCYDDPDGRVCLTYYCDRYSGTCYEYEVNPATQQAPSSALAPTIGATKAAR